MRKLYQIFEGPTGLAVTIEHDGLMREGIISKGYVKITIEDDHDTEMEVNGTVCGKLELVFRGNSERRTFLSAFKAIVKELEDNPYLDNGSE